VHCLVSDVGVVVSVWRHERGLEVLGGLSYDVGRIVLSHHLCFSPGVRCRGRFECCVGG
jgi:hypothetical protein